MWCRSMVVPWTLRETPMRLSWAFHGTFMGFSQGSRGTWAFRWEPHALPWDLGFCGSPMVLPWDLRVASVELAWDFRGISMKATIEVRTVTSHYSY